MRKFLLLVALAFLVGQGEGEAANLLWDKSPDPGVKGYRIYQATWEGDHTGEWLKLGEVKASVTTYTVDVPEGKAMVWYVTAIGEDGTESQASNIVELRKRGPLCHPFNLTFSD